MIKKTSLKKFSMIVKTSLNFFWWWWRHFEVFDEDEDIFEEVFDDGDDIFEEVFDDGGDIFVEIKERSFLVTKAKEVKIVEEVIRNDGLWRFACGDI